MDVDFLLPKVKANLILSHDVDDELLKTFIRAAVDYAVEFQKRDYGENPEFPPTTEQAIIMLSSHFYESRDGSTAGFFSDSIGAAAQVWATVNRLLLMNKAWQM